MPATSEQTRAAIETYVRAWLTNDKALLLSIFAEDAVWVDPVGTPPFVGQAGVARFWDFAHAGPKRSLSPRVEEIRVGGNEGLLRFVMEVRIPELNQGLDLSVIDYFLIGDDGRIKLAKAFWGPGDAKAPPGMGLFAPNVDEAHPA